MEMVDRVNQMRKTQFRKSFPHALSRFSLLHKNDNDDDEVDEKKGKWKIRKENNETTKTTTIHRA